MTDDTTAEVRSATERRIIAQSLYTLGALLCVISLVIPAPRPSTVLAHERSLDLASVVLDASLGAEGRLSQIASPVVPQQGPSALV